MQHLGRFALALSLRARHYYLDHGHDGPRQSCPCSWNTRLNKAVLQPEDTSLLPPNRDQIRITPQVMFLASTMTPGGKAVDSRMQCQRLWYQCYGYGQYLCPVLSR